MEMTVKMRAFWYVTPCSLVVWYKRRSGLNMRGFSFLYEL